MEDYCQIEFVDNEPVFVCNICNKGCDSEAAISKHINDEHESLMSDNSHDTDLYEGFDEDGNKILQIYYKNRNGPMGLNSQLPGDWSTTAHFVFNKLT